MNEALAGIDLPKTKHELVEFARARLPPEAEVLRVIRRLPARTYRTAGGYREGFRRMEVPLAREPG